MPGIKGVEHVVGVPELFGDSRWPGPLVPGNAVSSVGFLWVPPTADAELWGFCGGANTQVGEMVLTSRRDGTSTIRVMATASLG
jgi:hypothetical protein